MKILVTGASGSGTSTLGRYIAKQTGWGNYDADDFYWQKTIPPYQLRRDKFERAQLLGDAVLNKENVIVSGSIMNWDDTLENAFDVIVFLYLDTNIRVERLKVREMTELGSIDPEFITWAAEYDNGPSTGRSLSRHNQWLEERQCKVIRIEDDLSVAQRWQIVELSVKQRLKQAL